MGSFLIIFLSNTSPKLTLEFAFRRWYLASTLKVGGGVEEGPWRSSSDFHLLVRGATKHEKHAIVLPSSLSFCIFEIDCLEPLFWGLEKQPVENNSWLWMAMFNLQRQHDGLQYLRALRAVRHRACLVHVHFVLQSCSYTRSEDLSTFDFHLLVRGTKKH